MWLAVLSAVAVAQAPAVPEQREEHSFETDAQGQTLELVFVQSGERLQEMTLYVRQSDGTARTAIALRNDRVSTNETTGRCMRSKRGAVDFWWLGFDGFSEDRPVNHTHATWLALTEVERMEIMRRQAQAQLRKAADPQRYERPWWFTLQRESRGPHLRLSIDANHDGAPEFTRWVVLEWRPKPSPWVWRCAVREELFSLPPK